MKECSINVEEYEKLEAKVTDDEVYMYISELLEKQTQVEEQKQIITG